MDSNATYTLSPPVPSSAPAQAAQPLGGNSATTITSPPHTSSAQMSNAAMEQANEQVLGVYNLLILGFIVLLLLAAFPGAVVRLRHPNSWQSGWFLKHRKSYVRRAKEAIRRSLHLGPPGPQRHPTFKQSLILDAAPYATGDDSDFGHGVLPVRRVHKRGAAIIPPHVPGWTTMLYPISVPFSMPFFATGFSNAQAMIYGAYATTFITFAFVATSGGVTTLARSGWLVVANMPLMVALGSKNSIVGTMIGSHYGKLNFIHRFIGQLMFIASMYHVLGYLVVWLIKGTIDKAATHVSAWAAFIGLCIVAVASLPVIRRSAYNLFFHAHWIGYMVLMLAICFHVQSALYWTLGSFFLLGLDHVARLVKSHLVTANITSMPEFGATRIEIPQLTRGWRAGQHIRLRALSQHMGVKSFFEVHPFTIASVSENVGGEGLVLYVKKTGDWTKKLYAAADWNASSEFNEKTSIITLGEEKPISRNNSMKSTKSTKSRVEKGFGSGGTMRMIVEGPYGGPGNFIVTSFSAAFICVGGSGITYGMGFTEEIVRDTEALQSRIRVVHLVWVVQDPASMLALLPSLTSFLNRVAYLPTITLDISIHYTRAATTRFTEKIRVLPKHLHVRAGRPNVTDYMGSFVDATRSTPRGRDGLSGVAVMACGPKGLTDDVQAAVSNVTAEARKEVGGVEFIEESFSW